MPLDAARLGSAIAAAVAAASAPITPDEAVTQEQIDAIWIAVAAEIINEITTNAVVPGITAGGATTTVT